MILVFFAVCFFLLASTSFPALEAYSVGLRMLGSIVVIVPVIWRKRLASRASFPSMSRALGTVGIGFGTYLVASTLAHGLTRAFVLGLVSLLLVACLTYVLLHYYSASQIVGGVYAAFLVVCAVSLVAYLILPHIALENSRLRGVMENANGLGFVAFALGAVSVAARRNAWQSLLGLAVGLTCLFLSGSRAGMLALVLVVCGLALSGSHVAQLMVVFGGIVTGVLWLAAPDVLASTLLFRTLDTRSIGFETMQQAMAESYWTGLGELPAETMIAGSPFAAGITGGFWGLVGLSVMYFGLVRNLANSRPRALALVVAGIVHSLLESWMLSFSAPMLLTFFVMLVGFVKLDVEASVSSDLADSSSGSLRGDRRARRGGWVKSQFSRSRRRGE